MRFVKRLVRAKSDGLAKAQAKERYVQKWYAQAKCSPVQTISAPSISRRFRAIVLILILASGSIALAPQVWAQSPGLPKINLQQPNPINFSQLNDSEVDTGEVQLDGRDLFAIAAPNLSQVPNSPNATPIQQRIKGVEETLERIASSNFDPKTLEVTAEIDQSSNLPVISINDQYLMTVTTLDAQLQVQDLDRWANNLTDIIKRALIRAHQERQPEFLTRQGGVAAGTLLAMVCGSWGTTRLRQRLKARKKRLEAQIPPDPDVSTKPAGKTDSKTITTLQQQRTQRRHRDVSDVQHRLLQVGQAGIWAGGTFAILGMFPYTRYLQPLVLSTPLKLLAVGLVTYLLIRLSDVLIDRFSGALVEESFLDAAASQRLALRVSTFSRVLQSGAAVIWIVVGLLAGLSVVGVDLIPLVAGAGIIGLAISFAAQSLIKDMINGFLILSEDQYAVGDVITIGNVSGFVENMNLRITQLRNSEGQLITIPNSTITVVQNLSKDWSRVDLAIDLAYGTDPDHALEVIRQLAQEMYDDREWRSKMPDPPDVLGIDEVNHNGILIRVWIKTLPLQQWVVAREFRRRLALALKREGLAIGVPQQSLWFRSSADPDLENLDGNLDGNLDSNLDGNHASRNDARHSDVRHSDVRHSDANRLPGAILKGQA
ncbi:MAG: mechanosensitive ion channel family protein [Leptolyngbyaceae cyanobacterium CRU_2_3]|nr:mechanosensitive ion channel family protein [Leptolyngbyaceae cyanobacterium CRU_2_3]